jgi:NitT/TauT family transport system permease protein
LRKLRIWTGSAILAVVILAAWEIIPRALDIQVFILPPLSLVVQALTDPNLTGLYLSNLRVTVSEALIGLSVGTLAGLILGFLLAEFRRLYHLIYPYIIAVQSLPKVAIAPLLIVWFGFGLTSKVVVVALICFFPVLVNTITGLRSVQQDLVDLFVAHGASRSQIRWKLMFPNALPSIFAGFEVAVVNSLLGAIVGEFVGAQAGLGVMLLQAQYQLNIPGVFAILLILATVGIVFNLAVRTLRRRVLFWIPSER